MGNPVSKALAAARKANDDASKQLKADLDNLSVILRSKQEEFFTKLVNNKGEDKTIPIKTLLEYKKHYSVDVSTEPSKQLTDALEELFGGNFLNSLKALALGAINSVLGSASAGEREESGYKVLLLYNTVVRIDFYVWGYNMATKGIDDKKTSGLVFVSTIGVVDMETVGLESLVYLVGSQANQARSFVVARQELWQDRLNRIKANEDIPLSEIKGWVGSLNYENADAADMTTEDFKAADEAVATAAAPTATEAEKQAAATAVKAVANTLKPKLEDLISTYKDTLAQVTKDQTTILDQMTEVYMKAKGVSQVIRGEVPPPSLPSSSRPRIR